MKKYILDGEIYYLKDCIFYDKSFIEVDNRTAEKLMKLWHEEKVERKEKERQTNIISRIFGDNNSRFASMKTEEKPQIKRTQQKVPNKLHQHYSQLASNGVNGNKNRVQNNIVKNDKQLCDKLNIPQLKDFDLTEEDVETYRNQSEKYEKALHQASASNESLRKEKKLAEDNVEKITFRSGVVGFIVSVLIIGLNSETISGFWGFVLFVCGVVLVPFVAYKIARGSQWVLTKEEYYVDRYNYIDENLESRVSSFQSALCEYEKEEERKKISFWNCLSGHEFEKKSRKC